LDRILRYYKLLFTLPGDRTSLGLLLFSYLLLLMRNFSLIVMIMIYQLYYLILFYESRILNGRRLSFLFGVGNLLYLMKPELAITIYSMIALIDNPHYFTPFIASMPLLLSRPYAIIPIIVISASVAYGSKYGVTELGVAWLRAWMGDEYEKLERISTLSGEKKKARFYSFSGMIFTDVHFGLMRYSMGTLIPHLLMIRGSAPHRLCGSHENNPANRWESYKLLSRIFEVNENDDYIYEIVIEKGDGVESISLEGKRGCVKSVYHEHGADDLPCVHRECEVADPHNNEGPNPTKEQLLRELDSLKTVRNVKCKVESICDVVYDGKGLCTRRGKAVMFKCEDRGYWWLIVPGNNMVRGNRAKLVQGDVLEVSTLDDHTCAGFGRSKYEVSSVDSYEIKRCYEPKEGHWLIEVPYIAMGPGIYEPEVQKAIENSIRVGIISVATSLVLSLII